VFTTVHSSSFIFTIWPRVLHAVGWSQDYFAFSTSVSIYVSLCVRTYHVHNNYITYIVAMRPYLSWLRQFRQLLCVATVSSLAQLRVWDWYWEAEATYTWRRKADRERRWQKRAATCDAYRVAINQRGMAARRALGWIGTSNTWLVFRYEYYR